MKLYVVPLEKINSDRFGLLLKCAARCNIRRFTDDHTMRFELCDTAHSTDCGALRIAWGEHSN